MPPSVAEPNTGTTRPIFLANGYAGPDAFPGRVLAECAAEVLREQPDVALQYGPIEGLPEVRALVAEWLRADGQTHVADDDVLIVPGAKQALSLIAQAFAGGGAVLTSAPTYMTAVRVFAAHGLTTSGVATDGDGLVVAALEQRLSRTEATRPSLVYTMSDFHNPTGSVMSRARRQALVELAQRRDLVVLEDNPYRWLRFEGSAAPPLTAFDPSAAIISVGSFSKILAPGLRLAWVTLPQRLRDRLLAFGLELAASPLTQLLVHRYFQRVPLGEHLGQTTALYHRKRDIALDALDRVMPQGVTWNRPGGGYYIWLGVDGVDTDVLAQSARAAGVVVYPGSAFYPSDVAPLTTHVRLNYAHESPDRIAAGVGTLARVITQQQGQRRS